MTGPSGRSPRSPAGIAGETIPEILRRRAAEHPDGLGYTFLADGETEAGHLTWGELDRQALAIAAELRTACDPGDRALLLFPPGLDFIAAFFGCLYAGVVAVPAYPPRPGKNQGRLRSIAGDARPRVILTTSAIERRAGALAAEVVELAGCAWKTLTPVPSPGGRECGWERGPGGEGLAFLQYTSGSTAGPKGVEVTHANLIHNQQAIQQAFGQSEESVVVGWLPLYHDMGLIGNVLQPLFVGGRCVLMSPAAFLQRPSRWLRAISRYRATTSGGPNFAYDLCVRRIGPAEREGLDLSSWQVAFNGAEPVRSETMDRFAAVFSSNGFRREAFFPCYGLAEATLLVSGGKADPEPGQPLAGSGRTAEGVEVAVADPATGERKEPGEEGEIWVSGPGVARGYWGKPEETQKTFQAELAGEPGRHYLRTGDLGFLRDGELFVTGRIKDLILVRGRNLYPQDIERTAEESHPALRPGGGAAFAVEAEGEERLVVVHETEPRARWEAGEVTAAVRRAVADEHQAPVWEVALIPAGALPRTSSGKVRRGACREAFLDGSLPVLERHRIEPAEEDSDSIAPAEGMVEELARRVARLLGVAPSQVERDRPLGELGLDSLASIELRAKLEEDFGVEVPLADLLEEPSLETLAAAIEERTLTPRPPLPPALTPARERGREEPPSQGQRSLWFLQQITPGSSAQNLAVAGWVGNYCFSPPLPGGRECGWERGPGGEGLFGEALHILSTRHTALRTIFPSLEGEPVQRILADGGIDFATVEIPADLSDTAWLEQEAHRPFDLAEGPLVRVRLGMRPGCAPLLLFAAHHIAVDFGSLGVLLNELGELLEGRELPPVARQPADFARWQAEMLEGPRGERLWDFWRRQLEGPLPTTSLPADHPRRPSPVRPASQLPIGLPPEVTERLRSQARAGGRTLYAELLAGLFALLSRTTNEVDLLIGSPVSGRSAPGFAGTVGYLMNPLPMRAGISGEPPFGDFSSQIWRGVVEALENQDLPSHLIAERLRPQLRVLFTFNRPRPGEEGVARLAAGEGSSFDFGGLALEPVSVPVRETLFDLHLTLIETDGGLAGSLVYAADLYDAPTLQRFANHFRNLLTAISENPCTRLSDLSLFGEAERWQLLAEWNDTGNATEAQPVHRQFFDQAERTPGAAAVMSEWERLSYAELAGRARRLAQYLRSLGIGPEAKVGLCAERTPDAIVGLLGILESGAAYVPLDPAYPAERIAWILEDAGAAAVVSQRRLAGRLPEPGPLRVWLDEVPEESFSPPLPGDGSADGRGGRGVRANLAYVLYTSGSTGQPKGVLVSHEALASYVTTAASIFEIGPGDRVLQFASLGFDTSAEEIFPCLANGATLVLRTDAMVGSVPRFLEVCARWQVTVLDLPTAFWHEVTAGVEGLALPATLRLVVIGGERAAPGAVEAWRRWAPAVRLVNTYGPTEATIVATACDLPDPGDREGREVAIGRPIPGVRAYVLDRYLRPVPAGSPGELALAGAGLARGYLGRPDLTAERFVPDPFSAGDRLYRTGDRVRQRPDGTLEFAGRLDQQVKVRGYRVEPGEIETALASHPSVREAAVLAHLREGGDARLAAYVVPSGEAPDPSDLRRFLGERLPPYMVPGSFVLLPSLPRTATGKLDRSALPLPGSGPETEAPEVTAPRTPAEAALAAIWADCLEIGPFGIHDDFFALGGHSLLVTRVISRAREELGVELPLHVFFEAPTIAELALTVESAGRTDLPPIRRVPRDGREIPVSFAQERLWFLAQLDPASLAYGVPRVVHVAGRFDAWALERAYEALLARHESLRTVFPAIEGRPVQKILPPPRFTLSRLDLRALPESVRRAELERLIATEVRRPFDLSRGPLLRAELVLLGDESSTLIQTEHHIVHDGWTQGVLLDDLLALYTGFHEGRPASLPGLPVQYADFAVWQREWLQGEVLAAHLAYWKGKLEGMPPVLELPADRPRPPAQSFRGSTQWFDLPGDLLAGLSALARREGATLFMLLLAAFKVLLHRYARRDDLPVGSPIANRTHLEIEALIGFLVNTLLLRTDLSGSPSFRELLDRVRSTTLGAYAWQHLPFERLVEELDPERNLSYTPLCQVMLILQNARVPELRLPGLVLRHQEVHNGTAKFDLMMSLQERDGGLFGWVEYSTDLFDATTIERLRGHFGRLLESIVRAPEKRLLDFNWLSETEVRQLADWGQGTTLAPSLSFPSEAFATQAAITPEVTALVHGTQSITYRELDRRVEEWAHHLQGLGVGPEVRVGVCLDPGFDLVTALLAVLRAGGAYIPLDPSHPADRLKWILEDAGVAVVLAKEEVDLTSARASMPGLEEAPDESGLKAPFMGRFTLARRLIAGRERAQRADGISSDNLAYVIYTSGSTGRPKGVEVTRASLDHLLRSIRSRPGLSSPETVLSCTTVAFDVAGVELFLLLCTGGRIVLTDRDVATDGHRLAATLRRSGATLMQGTPATFSMLFEAGWEGDPNLRVWCAGEALPRALADRLAAHCAELWNLYGPTEATIYAAGCRIHSGEAGPVPIGGPAGGASLQILDPELRPVPAGVPGELFIGGPTVARGYLGRPDLTAARFVPDPFSPLGSRLYRTGDLVCWLPDGRIEFLGRLDHQVKLRGFRIELGEIEEALRLHPAISQAAAILAPGSSGDPRLVAYVVADLSEGEESPLDGWQRVWNEIYGGSEASRDAAFDLSGWISSYTGEPIGAAPMREWVERTVERILGVHSFPLESVLEIGCGTGLLLYRIAPHCRRYCATDLSAAVVERLRRGIEGDPSLGHVEVRAAPADDASVFEGETFDLIVLNSVVQYFPSVEYLVKVLEGIAPRLRPGGVIFLGDLRSLPLLETFRTGVQLHRASDDLPVETLRRRVREQIAREKELVLDPRLFTALVDHLGIGHAEVQLKRGRHSNELTRYRYDAILHAEPAEEEPAPETVDWKEIRTLAALRRRVEAIFAEGKTLAVRGISDTRLGEEAEAWRLLEGVEPTATVGELRRAVSAGGWGAVEPEDLWELAGELGGEAVVGWPETVEVGEFEAVFRPVGPSPPGPLSHPHSHPPGEGEKSSFGWGRPSPGGQGVRVGEGTGVRVFANHPRAEDPAERLAPLLDVFLRQHLPAYMLPSAFVVLDTLPLTPTGKVDRRALPLPEASRESAGAPYVPPRTPAEEELARIWSEVLGIDRVGARDDFFALGGHSLIATRLVSRIQRRFGVEMPLRALFEAPTLEALAGRIERALGTETAPNSPPPVVAGLRPEPIPLSFAQQRLWLLDRLGSGTAYNLPSGARLRGRLDSDLLERCLKLVVRRHEALRTVFPSDGAPRQEILPELHIPVPRIDLESLPRSLRETELGRAASELAGAHFDLSRPPLIRAGLFHLSIDDHALVLALHHIVADGWSQSVLIRELTALYRRGGDPGALPALPVQYADFAVWQRAWFSGEILEKELAYWRERLAGSPAALELPADRPRSAAASFRGARHRFHLPGRISRALAVLGGRGEATLFMTLLAAFSALLGRYSGQDDIVVGSPIAHRNRVEIENLIGFFVNTLALRVDLSGDPPFLELLARVREVTLGAYAHQDLPFERLVEELRPERNLGHSPLFQAVLVLHNTPVESPVESIETLGLTWKPLPVETGQSPFDLTLSLVETPGGLDGTLTWRRDLFEETTLRRMAGHLETLLAAVQPDSRLSSLPILSEGERQQVSREWGEAGASFPSHQRIQERFEVWAERTPDAVALVYEDERWTYAELDAQSNRLAGFLEGLGVGPERIVAIALERSPEIVTAILAVWKADGAYLPLDPAQPAPRRESILREARPVALLTTSDLARSIQTDFPVVCVDDLPGLISPPRSRPLGGEGQLAYVIYTSGSTGQPKGCMISHSNVVRLLDAGVSAFGFGPGDVWTLFHSYTFDFSVWEMWGALALGGRLVGVPYWASRSPADYLDLLRRERATVINQTPSAFRGLMRAESEAGGGLESLRRVFVGGETLPLPMLEAWLDSHEEIFNVYGLTETAVLVSSRRITAADLRTPHRSPIGRPLPNLRILVLDRHAEPVPAGVPGELYVGGTGVGRGYLQQPGWTADRFVPDPFSTGLGERLYRTGDLVRFGPDGDLEYLGRTDHQVKIRGFRIELGEIEAALAAQPAVAGAAVVVRDHGVEKRIVAYVVPRQESNGDLAAELRRSLLDRLPEYMAPAAFVMLADLPLNANGKVDHRALPEPESAQPPGEAAPPRNPVEEALASLFADALDLPSVGIHDSFFDLGGHSLLATSLIAEIREVLEVDLPLRTLFTAPTVAGLAVAMMEKPEWGEAAERSAELLRTLMDGDQAR